MHRRGIGHLLLPRPRSTPIWRTIHTPKVKRLPVFQSTSCSGISVRILAMKLRPVQCIGITTGRSCRPASAGNIAPIAVTTTYDGERVDAASDPTRIGSDQVRGVRFEGERMVLIPPLAGLVRFSATPFYRDAETRSRLRQRDVLRFSPAPRPVY
jgi:hypothetical protein